MGQFLTTFYSLVNIPAFFAICSNVDHGKHLFIAEPVDLEGFRRANTRTEPAAVAFDLIVAYLAVFVDKG